MHKQTAQNRVLIACALKRNTLRVFAFGVSVFVILAIVIGGQFAGNAQAATPTLNFQARLESSSGAIAQDGNYNIQFKLYQGGTTAGGGTLKWTEDWLNNNGDGVYVANGYLTVNLGSITSFPGTINWDDDLFLGLNVGNTNGTCTPFASCSPDGEMTPLLKLTSVPYAFQAQSATQLQVVQGAYTGTLAFDTLTSSQSILLPDASGTVCLDDSVNNCGYLTGSAASGSYVQLQGTTPGSVQTGNFNISGTGIAATLQGSTSVLTPLLDTASAVALNVGTTNATQINLNKNVVVAASQSLTLTGGNTASRPGSPTEGMLYYDTTTKKLLVYSNGKWQADRSTATVIVGTNASGGASSAVASLDADGADYLNTSTTSAQTTINNALTAVGNAGGGTVYLMEGTYIIDGTILVPSNVTLTGAGAGTVIKLKNGINAGIDALTNSDTTNGNSYITISNLKFDGNKANNSSGTQQGIVLTKVSTIANTTGAKLDRLWIENFRNRGTHLNSSSYSTVTNSVFRANSPGLEIASATNSVISSNLFVANGSEGLWLNTNGGNVTATGNTSQGNSGSGIRVANGSQATISTNFVSGNGGNGIQVGGSGNVISANKLHDNGGSGSNDNIAISGSNNIITSNNITDTAGTGYAINITGGTANYLADNTYTGTGATSINNAGTNTVFGGQLDGSNAYVLQASGGINLNSAVTTSANLTVTSAGNVAFQRGSNFATTGTSNDVNLGTGALFRLTGASSQTITGLSGGTDGRILTIINAAGQAATISNNSGSSSAANRIVTGTGSDLTLAAGASISLVYDTADSLWRVVGGSSGIGGGVYVTLQGTTPGTADTGNLNITGTAIAATVQGSTSVLTPLLDRATSGVLDIGTTNATQINLNQNVVVAANKTLRLAGGNTAGRPVAPAEGTLYYDTSTHQLLQYNGTKWVSDRRTAVTVAASNSSQADKDAADYQADGTDDQVQINQALTAAAGGTVYLLPGTYYAQQTNNGDATIFIPNQTTLTGAGSSNTALILDTIGGVGSDNLIENQDTATGLNVSIRNLSLDNSTATGGTQNAIVFSGIQNVGRGTVSGLSVFGWLQGDVLDMDDAFLIDLRDNTMSGAVSLVNGSHIANMTDNVLFSVIVSGSILGKFQNNAVGSVTITSSILNMFTGNHVGAALTLDNVNDAQINGNTFNNSGSYNSIDLTSSTGNSITNNKFIDAGSTGYAIALDATSNQNIISGNDTDGLGLYDPLLLTSGNHYEGLVGNDYVLQPATGGSILLYRNTTISANLTVTGSVAFQRGNNYSTTGTSNDVDFGAGALFRLTGASAQTITGITGGTNGRIITLINAGSNAATISNNSGGSLIGNKIITGTGADLTLATGASISLVYDSASSLWRVVGGSSGIGGGVYVTLQGTTPGTADTGNLNITGTAIAATVQGSTSVVTPLVDTSSATTLSVGTGVANAVSISRSGITTTINGALTVTQASTFNGTAQFNQNVTVAASKTLRMIGDTTANRPTCNAGAEGTLYYDTDTHRLLQCNGTKWVSDNSSATKIVAASNSSQAIKDAADYVATGTGDQGVINTALTAAAGGKVYLAEGTYTVNASISVPNNTTLAGAGAGTVITIPNSLNSAINIITNSDTSTGTGIVIHSLKINGNRSNQASGTMRGIYLSGMGGGTGASARQGALIKDVWINSVRNSGVFVISSANMSLVDSVIQDNNGQGVYIESTTNATIANNRIQGNAVGIYLFGGAHNNTINGNTFEGNTSYTIWVESSNDGVISNNIILNGSSHGMYLDTVLNATITGNNIKDTAGSSMYLANSNYNVISSNKLTNSSGAANNNAVYLTNSDNNTVSSNTVTDSSATTTNYALNISGATSDNTYLADNTLGGASINNAGTGTIYGGQVDSSTNYRIQPAGTIELLKNTNITGNLTATGTASVTGGSITVSTTTATDDTLRVLVSSFAGTSFQGTVTNANLTAARTWTLPDVSGTFCLDSGNCSGVGGYVALGPAAIQTDSSTNNSIYINKTGASGNIVYLQRAGADVFRINNSGDLIVGNGTNNVTFSASGNFEPLLNGGAQHSKKIVLTPEYAGAALDYLSDASCSSASSGTMTSGYDSAGRTNYYNWTSVSGTAQCYDVVVQVPIPSDWSSWTSTPINLQMKKDSTGTAAYGIQVINSSGSADTTFCASGYCAPGSLTTSWGNMTTSNAFAGSGYTAGDYFTIKVRLTSTSSAQTFLGNITLNYKSKY